MEFGFEHEQSYIRAFKQEFGMTPGEFRKSGAVVKVPPPLQLFDVNKINNGILFGPEIFMVPAFHLVGKRHIISFSDSIKKPPEMAKKFWHTQKKQTKYVIDPDIYYGLTRIHDIHNAFSYCMPAVKVINVKNIPVKMFGYLFRQSN